MPLRRPSGAFSFLQLRKVPASWGKAWGLQAAPYRQDPVYLPDLLAPYVKNTQIFMCPSETGSSYSYITGNGGCSYVWNFWDKNSVYHAGQELATITEVSKAPLLMDMPCQIASGIPHNGGVNIAYADGHGKWSLVNSDGWNENSNLGW